MNLKIFIILFPIYLFSQNNDEIINKIKIIDSYVKNTDSISNFIEEEILTGEVRVSHSNQTEKINPLFYNTRILKNLNQIIRICYSEKENNKFEDWKIYFFESKIIYIEIISGRIKKKKKEKNQYYFENEILIYPEYSAKLNVKDEVDIILKAKNLFKKPAVNSGF